MSQIPLDIHGLIVKHPMAVFYFRAEGAPNNTEHERITGGDVLVVDRLEAKLPGALVLVIEDETFVVGRLMQEDDRWYFMQDDMPPTRLEDERAVFGVITHIIHEVHRQATR